MAVTDCIWCETQVKPDADVCPECGLQNPAGGIRGSSKVVRRGQWAVLTFVAVPLMLSMAYAAHLSTLSLRSSDAVDAPTIIVARVAPIPAPSYANPLQQSVWTNGVRAVRRALGQPGYSGCQNSFVNVASGNLVSLCGQVPGTAGYGGVVGRQRFISVFGQAVAIVLDCNDRSFEVLWNRVCTESASAALGLLACSRLSSVPFRVISAVPGRRSDDGSASESRPSALQRIKRVIGERDWLSWLPAPHMPSRGLDRADPCGPLAAGLCAL